MKRIPLSVLVATRNEEQNLPSCLGSVSFADEILIADSASSDRTCAVARSAGGKVIQFPGRAATGMPKRTWVLETYPFRNEWILVLDADERVTERLRDEIVPLLHGLAEFDAYYLPFRLMFMGRWIRHCGWYPGYQLRLFRLGRAHYEKPQLAWLDEMGDVEVHERIVSSSRPGFLKGEVLHDDYKGLASWIEKHNRYSSWEAAVQLSGTAAASDMGLWKALMGLSWRDPIRRRRALRHLAARIPGRPVATFFWMYLVKRGFLDGYAGAMFCIFHSIHQLHIDLKVKELARGGG